MHLTRIRFYLLDMGRIMILAFIILLVMALVSEARNDVDSAEYYSIYAYYFLVVGVILIILGESKSDGKTRWYRRKSVVPASNRRV